RTADSDATGEREARGEFVCGIPHGCVRARSLTRAAAPAFRRRGRTARTATPARRTSAQPPGRDVVTVSIADCGLRIADCRDVGCGLPGIRARIADCRVMGCHCGLPGVRARNELRSTS